MPPAPIAGRLPDLPPFMASPIPSIRHHGAPPRHSRRLRSAASSPTRREPSIITIWAVVRFVHVLSSMAWVGGQLLLSLLVLPVLRRRMDAATRAPLTREVGIRFGVFTVEVFLPLQILTGIALAGTAA